MGYLKIQDSVKKVNELIKLTQDIGTNSLGQLVNRCKRDTLVNDLHNDDIDIFSTMSKIKFSSELDSFINELRGQDKSCDEADYKAFNKHVKDFPLDSYDVYAELFGLKLRRGLISLGDFTIYDHYQSYSDIIKKYPRIGYNVYDKLREMHITLVCISVTSRDCVKAEEIAADYFQKFEYTLLYYISPHNFNSTHVRICHGFLYSKVKMLCVSDSSIHEYKSTPENTKVYEFDSYVDVFNKASNPVLWKLITKSSDMNHIEKRLSLAIEWYGKASIEKNTTHSILQYCMAVESLVSLTDRNQKWQFKYNTAIIVGDTPASRKDIVGKMGPLYKTRSKIVHGENNGSHVSYSDISIIKIIAYKLIERFISHEPLCNFTTNKELTHWIDIQKQTIAEELASLDVG